MRCRNAVVFALGCAACSAPAKDPAPVGMSAGSVTVSGGLTATDADPQTSSGDSGTASGTGTGATSGTDTGSGTADSTSGSETTGTVAGCVNVDDACEGDGFCVLFQGVLRCSHGEIGDPCDGQGNDCGLIHQCVLTDTDAGALGVCTGGLCDAVGDLCETNGVCAQVNVASGPVNYCSHGGPWEPCTVDDDCISGACDPFDDAFGVQNRCK